MKRKTKEYEENNRRKTKEYEENNRRKTKEYEENNRRKRMKRKTKENHHQELCHEKITNNQQVKK